MRGKTMALFAVLICGFWITSSIAAPATRPVETVCVKTTSRWGNNEIQRPLMVRELFRQALLIAARDGLGLATRNQTLGEKMTDPATAMEVVPAGPTPVTIAIYGNGKAPLWKKQFDVPDWGTDCLKLTEIAEQLSRTDYVELLRKQGFRGKTIAPSEAPAPAGVEQLLGELNEISQFAALRLTHRAIRQSGESPERLGALVRAYANLGQLTSFHWTSEHKAFKARALLYAQRMVVANPHSAFALWHRAYARALVGLQGAAMQDLSAAANLHDDHPPKWVALLQPYCEYDTGKLIDLAGGDPDQRALGSFMAFLTVERCGSQGAVMNLASVARQANPQCLHILDTMCAHTGPGMLNSLSAEAPQVLEQMVQTHLSKMPDLPDSVRATIKTVPDLGKNWNSLYKVLDSLDQSAKSDDGEPSRSMLSWLIKQDAFVQYARRADLIWHKWGQDPSGFAREVLPYVEDHPYKAYFDACMIGYRASPQMIRRALSDVDVSEADFPSKPMTSLMRFGKVKIKPAGCKPWYIAYSHADPIAGDAEWILSRYAKSDKNPAFVVAEARLLKKVSPRDPLVLARLIKRDWQAAQPLVKQWEQTQQNHPAITYALGCKYAELSQYGPAERMLKQYIDIAQDQKGYFALATVYWKEGKQDQWLATLKDFLKQKDYGLQHAQAQVMIADYFIKKGDYQQAVGYADDAAQTGASWAMRCAACAHEGLGQWDKAEAWIAEDAQHYNQIDNWYEWCVRTGHGHIEAAQKAADVQRDSDALRDDRESITSAATIYLMEGDKQNAVKYFQQSLDKFGDAWAGLHAALIYDAAGDAAHRDAAIEAVIAHGGKHLINNHLRTEMVALARLLKGAYATPSPKLKPSDIEAALRGVPTTDACNTCYFAAEFLKRFGQKDEAMKYLKRCAGGPILVQTNLVLSWRELRQSGVDPQKLTRLNVSGER